MKKVVNPILKLVQSVPFLFQHQCLSNIHALVFGPIHLREEID